MESQPIEHVSDTALWVATYRALETERPDAAFRDPLASRLVGERGRRIAASMARRNEIMSWVMVLRTVALDRLLLEAIAAGCDTVVNLGAGLDTRPYRLELPKELRWIEVDFPHMVRLKDEQLASEKPACNLERVALDLSDLPDRQALFRRVAEGGKQVAVLTEGLLPYLSNQEAESLARDLRAEERFRFWIHDFHDGEMVHRVRRMWGNKLDAAPFKLAVSDWFGFLGRLGWGADEIIYAQDEAERLRRRPPFFFPWSLLFLLMPRARKEQMRRMSGYVRVEQAPIPEDRSSP